MLSRNREICLPKKHKLFAKNGQLRLFSFAKTKISASVLTKAIKESLINKLYPSCGLLKYLEILNLCLLHLALILILFKYISF